MNKKEADELIKQWVPFAWKLALQFHGRWGLDENEALSAAMLGLCRAPGRWDPAQGAFSTCASYSIRGELMRARHLDDLVINKSNTRPVCQRAPGPKYRGQMEDYTAPAYYDTDPKDFEYLLDLSTLTDKEKYLMRQRSEGVFLSDLGKQYDVTGEAIRQWCDTAMKQLRLDAEAAGYELEDFLI